VRRRTIGLWTGACACGLALLGACGDQGGSTADFCADVRAHRDEILAVPPTADEIDAFVDLHRDIGRVAPLAIEEEWNDLVVNYETASTVDPGDPESVQRTIETALRTERSVLAVQEWVAENCQVDLGPVATMQAPATTTIASSVPPPDDAPPPDDGDGDDNGDGG
jgi:hypothetical protein